MILFGATSMVGWNVWQLGKEKGLRPFCSPYSKLDACESWERIRLEERSDYRDLFQKETPSLLIHAGGVCDVDECEANPDWAYDINVKGMDYLMEFLPSSTRLVYVSTDHVFGDGPKPFDEESEPQPISIYGQTRAQAEERVLRRKENTLLLRVGLGIGPSITGRTGHLDWLRYRKKKGLPLTVIQDEFRSAVWATDLAKRIMDFAVSDQTGVRHIPATRAVSRPELASFLNDHFKIGAQFKVEKRTQQKAPHLGRVELTTRFQDDLAQPLPSVVS